MNWRSTYWVQVKNLTRPLQNLILFLHRHSDGEMLFCFGSFVFLHHQNTVHLSFSSQTEDQIFSLKIFWFTIAQFMVPSIMYHQYQYYTKSSTFDISPYNIIFKRPWDHLCAFLQMYQMYCRHWCFSLLAGFPPCYSPMNPSFCPVFFLSRNTDHSWGLYPAFLWDVLLGSFVTFRITATLEKLWVLGRFITLLHLEINMISWKIRICTLIIHIYRILDFCTCKEKYKRKYEVFRHILLLKWQKMCSH